MHSSRLISGFMVATTCAAATACSPPSLPTFPSPGYHNTSYSNEVVFSRLCCHAAGSFVMVADTGHADLLLASSAAYAPTGYAVRPDGRWLAVSMAFGKTDQIFIVDSTGSNSRRFPTDTSWSYSQPAWSPDGRRIAFAQGWDPTFRTLDDSSRLVYTANADGSGMVVVGDSALVRSAIAWSHDGQRIIYSRLGQLVIVNADGTSIATQAIPGGDSASDPAMSPDGTRIAYARGARTADLSHIAIIGADGGAVTPVTTGGGQDYRPAWSPDGQRLIFTRFLAVDDPIPGYSIIGVVDADGSRFASVSSGESYPEDAWATWGPIAH